MSSGIFHGAVGIWLLVCLVVASVVWLPEHHKSFSSILIRAEICVHQTTSDPLPPQTHQEDTPSNQVQDPHILYFLHQKISSLSIALQWFLGFALLEQKLPFSPHLLFLWKYSILMAEAADHERQISTKMINSITENAYCPIDRFAQMLIYRYNSIKLVA